MGDLDVLRGASPGWLTAAIVLHLGGQLARGLAWRAVLEVAWPGVARRSACAWHVCGAGLSGLLSARGGDAVRIALARRRLADGTVPALAGTLAAEASFESACGLLVTLAAVSLGAGTLGAPPPLLALAGLTAAAATLAVACRHPRVRRLVRDMGRGMAVLARPRTCVREVLPWQVCGRVLRLCAMCCFLLAFALPVTPALVFGACAAQGSAGALPVPGAGPAATGAALLVIVPLLAGPSIAPGVVPAFAFVVPVALTVVGVALSLGLLLAARLRARACRP